MHHAIAHIISTCFRFLMKEGMLLSIKAHEIEQSVRSKFANLQDTFKPTTE